MENPNIPWENPENAPDNNPLPGSETVEDLIKTMQEQKQTREKGNPAEFTEKTDVETRLLFLVNGNEEQLSDMAKNPNIPQEVMAKLLQEIRENEKNEDRGQILREIACNPQVSEEDLDKILDEDEVEFYEGTMKSILENRHTNLPIIQKLYKKTAKEFKIKFVEHENTPVEIIQEILDDAGEAGVNVDHYLLEAIRNNKNISDLNLGKVSELVENNFTRFLNEDYVKLLDLWISILESTGYNIHLEIKKN